MSSSWGADKTRLIYISVGTAILAGAAIYLYVNRDTILKKSRGTILANAPGGGGGPFGTHTGGHGPFGEVDNDYNVIENPENQGPTNFADMIDTGDRRHEVRDAFATMKPLERLERLQDNLMPSTAAHLPQYNIDIANPATHSFSVNAPRVILRNRLNMQADPYRGDVFIRYHPDIPLIAKSSHGMDAWRGDGFFSEHFSQLYNKFTGRAYRNTPLNINTEGTSLDYVDGE